MKQVRVLLITALLTAVFCTGCKNTAKGGAAVKPEDSGKKGAGITGIKAESPMFSNDFYITNITPDSFFETITTVTFSGADGTAKDSKLSVIKSNDYYIDSTAKKICIIEPHDNTVIGFKNGDKDLGGFKYNKAAKTFTKQ